jgi:hypothetical protein
MDMDREKGMLVVLHGILNFNLTKPSSASHVTINVGRKQSSSRPPEYKAAWRKNRNLHPKELGNTSVRPSLSWFSYGNSPSHKTRHEQDAIRGSHNQAVSTNFTVFRDVTPCRLDDKHWYFERTCCRHVQGTRWRQHAPPKRRYLLSKLHGGIFQKEAVLIRSIYMQNAWFVLDDSAAVCSSFQWPV